VSFKRNSKNKGMWFFGIPKDLICFIVQYLDENSFNALVLTASANYLLFSKLRYEKPFFKRVKITFEETESGLFKPALNSEGKFNLELSNQELLKRNFVFNPPSKTDLAYIEHALTKLDCYSAVTALEKAKNYVLYNRYPSYSSLWWEELSYIKKSSPIFVDGYAFLRQLEKDSPVLFKKFTLLKYFGKQLNEFLDEDACHNVTRRN
jgi:hypothetical protein